MTKQIIDAQIASRLAMASLAIAEAQNDPSGPQRLVDETNADDATRT